MTKIKRDKLALFSAPTPLEEMPTISALYDGPQLSIKRDDCTGLATGGNKTRKLEYLLAQALKEDATVLVTVGRLQSNHARQTAAAACKAGLKCVVVLERVEGTGGEDYLSSGNVLLDHILGAQVEIVPDGCSLDACARGVIEQLKAQGETPYFIPMGGSDAVGACGYVECALELLQQSQQLGNAIDVVVHATGSAGTQAGLIAGMELSQAPTRVIGVCVSKSAQAQRKLIEDLLQPMSVDLGFDLQSAIGRIEIRDEYYGEGYGIPTQAMIDAVELAARNEAILLDPVYSGKAMAGLLDMLDRGEFNRGEHVVFLHTGGSAGLFAYKDLFIPRV